jgi:acetolactate synthase-1/3 small subunit
MARHTLSVLVNNHMGVLSRVSGLFSRRGYNIESLSVGETENKEVSRMTIMVDCEDEVFIQIKNQLQKLMDVLTISDLAEDQSIRRELALIKIDAAMEKRSQILEIINIFRAHVIDVTKTSLILEITGDHSKVSAIISMLDEYGIKEVIRTGITAIARGDSELKKANNEED